MCQWSKNFHHRRLYLLFEIINLSLGSQPNFGQNGNHLQQPLLPPLPSPINFQQVPPNHSGFPGLFQLQQFTHGTQYQEIKPPLLTLSSVPLLPSHSSVESSQNENEKNKKNSVGIETASEEPPQVTGSEETNGSNRKIHYKSFIQERTQVDGEPAMSKATTIDEVLDIHPSEEKSDLPSEDTSTSAERSNDDVAGEGVVPEHHEPVVQPVPPLPPPPFTFSNIFPSLLPPNFPHFQPQPIMVNHHG